MLPATELDTIMNWITSLPYPWCSADDVISAMPQMEELTPVRVYLRDARPIEPER